MIRGDITPSSALPDDLKQALARMRDQVLIVLVKRAGGKVTTPVSEIDSTGQDFMTMETDPEAGTLTFEVRKKS